MKKTSLLSILLTSSILVSCGSTPTTEPTVEPTVEMTPMPPEQTELPTIEPTVEPTEQPTVEPTIEMLYLNPSYQMIYGDLSEDGLYYLEEYIYTFIDNFNLEIYGAPVNEPLSDSEILLGITNREESISLNASIMPTSFAVKVVDSKIVVAANNEEALIRGMEHLQNALIIDEFGVGLPKDYCYYGDKYMDTYIPCLNIKDMDAKDYKLYYANANTNVMSYSSSSKNDFDNYESLLVSSNYKNEFSNQIDNNYFTTYSNDVAVVNLAYYSNDKKLTVIYTPKTYLPNQNEITNKIVEPSFTQIGRNGASQSSSGLSMTFQLEDGSYIQVDGGPNDSTDEANLLKFFKDNNPNEGKPKITWIFTHAHHDHMNLALSFLEKYHDEIEVTLFSYNFPSIKDLPITDEPASRVEAAQELMDKLDEIRSKYYADVPVYKHHTGDILRLAGCEITFLQTHESYYPNEFGWFNTTSSAFIVTINNKKIMVLGDSEYTNNEYLSYLYDDVLKSDILQLAHHGLNGGSLALYQEIDPSICIWAIDKSRYETNSYCLGNEYLCECNKWLRNDSVRVRKHYHASTTTTILIKDI